MVWVSDVVVILLKNDVGGWDVRAFWHAGAILRGGSSLRRRVFGYGSAASRAKDGTQRRMIRCQAGYENSEGISRNVYLDPWCNF